MNEQETIDGVKGEWRTVTKPEEVKVNQRARFEYKGLKIGYTGEPCFPDDSCERYIIYKDSFFGEKAEYENLQAFFPLPVKAIKRKVAKVLIDEHSELNGAFDCRVYIAKMWFSLNDYYMSKKSAIRGAKRFCKAIGYECEIVKG